MPDSLLADAPVPEAGDDDDDDVQSQNDEEDTASMAGLKRGYTKMAKELAELKETQKKHLTYMKSIKVGIDHTLNAHGIRVNSIERRVVEIEDYYKEDEASHPTQAAAAQPVAASKKSSVSGI